MADAPASIGQVLESITLNNIVTDNIITNSDVDYFKVPASALTQDSLLNVNFSGLAASADEDEFLVSIRNAADTVLASSKIGSQLVLSASVDANTAYYVRVERGDSLRLDNYTLSVDLTPTVEIEDNDLSISATPLLAADALANNSAVVKGILGSAATPDGSDVDWYSFTTGSQIGTSVTLNITAATDDADVYTVSVYDSSVDEVVRNQSGQPLTTSVGTNAGSLTFNLTGDTGLSPAGTYFVSVQALDASGFAATSEAGQQYSISLQGTTDFNVAPVLTVGAARSGTSGSITNSDVVIANNTVIDREAAAAERVFATQLSDVVSVSDKNDDAANGAILAYAVGLLNEADFASATGTISYTDDDTNETATISAQSSIAADGFFVSLSAAEFATARYQSANTTQEQRIYIYAKDGSGVSTDVSTLNNPNDLSGILSFTVSTQENLGDLPAEPTPDDTGGSATVSATATFWSGGAVLDGQAFSVLADGQSTTVTADTAGVIDVSQFVDATVRISASLTNQLADNVDLIDALQIVKHIAGTQSLTGSALIAADVTGDGNVNSADVTELVSILASQKDADLVLVDANGRTSFDVGSQDLQLTGVVLGDVNGTYADIL
ncbi:MAG: dockerin type I domain-containing protein [Parvibaculales bacterium]